jgi:4-hydroxybenzoyl-CoA reductase gamma subunit
VRVALAVNGELREADVPSATLLVDLLRAHLGLTGTKIGCGHGECGACTVLLDGEPVNSCLVFAAQCDGREVTTIEGISANGELDRIQRAFIETGAVQCGFCTPGMIMSAAALLATNPRPSREEIEEALSGNLCRCTGYVKIVDAVELAASTD